MPPACPRAWQESAGIEYEHEYVTLDQAVPEPSGRPSPNTCCWVDAEGAAALADALRPLEVTSIGAGEGYLESQLEARGLRVVGVDADSLPAAQRHVYKGFKQYCSEVRRVPADALFRIPRPESSALLFAWGRSLPWRAYLARYPKVRVVAIVGDTELEGLTEPSALALAASPRWRLRLRRPVSAVAGKAELCVYERVEGALLSDADDELHRAWTERPRLSPGWVMKWDPEFGLPLY